MGESPIYSCKAHVFHIDPVSKKSWLPASSGAVPVSFFYDSSRGLYRIISVEGSKAVINSTLTPSMSFTKTSQKFGQWSDVRANTVYGLGFLSEPELNQFIEQFQEVKEATRRDAKSSGGGGTNGRPPPPDSTHPTIPPPSIMGGRDGTSPYGRTGGDENQNESLGGNNTLKGVVHQRSQSLSAVGVGGGNAPTESPKHGVTPGGKPDLLGQSPEAQLKYENERLRQALAQSSANAEKWKVELATLKSNNARLTAALTESTANVEEWKKQLQAYKEENQRMKQRVLEAEAAMGKADAAAELRKEIGLMRDKADFYAQQLKQKEEEVKILKEGKGDAKEADTLRTTLQQVQAQLETALGASDSQRRVLEALNTQLADKIQELAGIHGEINTALHS